jgi:acyl-CoA synthetase (AMP-forming)/AMP-acid ligase II
MTLLAARLAAHADASRVAIAEPRRTITYGALWDLAQRFAGMLAARGIGAGDRVALLLGNSIEAVAATYGSWLVGAALVPLNVQARARDYGVWLAHAQPRLVVHEAGSAEVHVALATLDRGIARIAVGAGDAQAPSWSHAVDAQAPIDDAMPVAAGDLAQILYTSGTTGAPKGVMLTHGNLASNVEAIVDYLGLDARDSIVSVLPFYYSYGASVLHTHIAVGARLCLEPNLVFPQIVVERLARERATGFSGVPSTFALLLDRTDLGAFDLSALRYLTQAGGPMAPALTRRLRAALPAAKLYVMYGQTEATARLAWLPPERLDEKLGAVGLPIRGVELAVRHEDGSPAAVDEAGEVWARGPNVMAGYWRNPEATAAVLHDGWLKTGDLGRIDADGFLWLAGRRADMIKTGAHRVHPVDVEEAIAELPGVAEVAVVGIDDALLGQVIRACIVRAGPLDENTVRAHCRARLAVYKVPKQVVFVDALPKTASGKVKRVELAADAASTGMN